MLKALLRFVLFLLPAYSRSFAQIPVFQYGFTASACAKFGLIQKAGNYYSPIGTAGIMATGRENGTTERSFCWQQHFGISYDKISYKAASGDFLHAELYNFLVEPEVLMPTKKERIHISVGIGVFYTFSVDAVSHSNSQSTGNFFSNIDSFGNTLEGNSRSLLPFISTGVIYQFRSRYQAACKLRQMLRNSFEPDASTTYYINREPQKLALSYQPTFLEVSMTYFLRNKEER